MSETQQFMTPHSAAKALRNLAEIVAAGRQNWDSFEEVCRKFFEDALSRATDGEG